MECMQGFWRVELKKKMKRELNKKAESCGVGGCEMPCSSDIILHLSDVYIQSITSQNLLWIETGSVYAWGKQTT